MNLESRVTVIALHGIAQCDAEIDLAMAQVMQQAGSPRVRWIFPRASRRNLTILGGASALAWYDVSTCDRSRLDEVGIEEATAMICRTVRKERANAPFGRPVILMGFSLGGALALNAGLRLQGEIDGIIALATAVPLLDHICEATPQSPPVFFGHGFLDTVVPYTMGRQSQRLMASKHYETEWHTYAYGHSTGRRQLSDISSWLQRRFVENEAEVLRPTALNALFPAPRAA
jgi:phospholipase/carboxylesterase